MSKETLDLSTVFDRDDVKLRDGRVYEIRNPDEFGMLDDHRLDALMKRAQEARDKAVAEDATEDDAKHASDLLREIATLLIIDFPAEGEIGDWESVAIFQFHMKKRLARAEEQARELGIELPPPTPAPTPAPRKKPQDRKRSTKAKSSPASRRSTAARRTTG